MRYIATQSFILYLLIFCVVIGSVSCERNQDIQHDKKKTLSFNRQQSDTEKLFKARLIVSFCAFHIVQIEDSAFYGYGMNWTNAEGKEYRVTPSLVTVGPSVIPTALASFSAPASSFLRASSVYSSCFAIVRHSVKVTC